MQNQIIAHGQVEQTLNVSDGENYAQLDPFIGVPSPVKQLPYPQSNTIWLSARKGTFDINQLGNTIHVYSSINYSDIIALELYFADWGFSYNWVEGPNIVLQVTIPFDTMSEADFTESIYTAEKWEIVPKQTTRAITNSALFDSAGTAYYLPQVYKVAVELAYKNNTATITLPTGIIPSSQTAGYIAQANLILQLKRAGIGGTYSFTQTLKRTAVVDFNNINGAFETTADIQYRDLIVANGAPNIIYSTTDLINKYQIDAATQAQMLPSYAKQISVGTIDQIEVWAYAGWLVKAPTKQEITKNKQAYQQLFEWDEWIANFVYIYNDTENNFPTINTNPNGNAYPV